MSYDNLIAANESYSSSRFSMGLDDNYKALDFGLILIVTTLVAIGFVMIYSATVGMSGKVGGVYYLQKQIIAAVIASLLMISIIQLPATTLRIFSRWSILFAIFLLILVFIPGIGKVVNGARRWIGYGGFNFQPAELAKICIVLYIADYIARRPNALRSGIFAQFPIIVVIAIVGVLLIIQRDHGTLMILSLVVLSMMFIGGLKWWVVCLLSVLGVLGINVYIKYLAPDYIIKRITVFLNPLDDPTDTGYQLLHSLIAYGRGQFGGVGLGESIEKLRYLPEVHNDFIMSLIAEETGLIGVFVIISLYALLVFRGFAISKMAVLRNDLFGAVAVYGITLWIGMQAFINIAVTMSFFPTKGFTLPFISYGSSSLIVLGIAMGVVLNVGRQKEVLNPMVRELKQKQSQFYRNNYV